MAGFSLSVSLYQSALHDIPEDNKRNIQRQRAFEKWLWRKIFGPEKGGWKNYKDIICTILQDHYSEHVKEDEMGG